MTVPPLLAQPRQEHWSAMDVDYAAMQMSQDRAVLELQRELQQIETQQRPGPLRGS